MNSINGTDESDSSTHVGGLGWFDFYAPISIRTGLFYTGRNFNGIFSGVYRRHRFTYFDLPITLSYQASNTMSIFAGTLLSVSLDDRVKIPGGQYEPIGLKEIMYPLTVGATLVVVGDFAAELFYEQVQGKIYNEVENMRSIGLNLLYFMPQ